jgi:hypothetical protein
MSELKETFLMRAIRVPLGQLPDEQWLKLRSLAFTCAAFGNQVLSEQYARTKGFYAYPQEDEKRKKTIKTYKDFREVLSSFVRDAITQEVQGIWTREGKKVLRGERSLPTFAADRSITIRDRGVGMEEIDGSTHCRLSLEPGAWLSLRLQTLRGRYLKGTIEYLLAHPERLRKAALAFRRPGRKVFCWLYFQKEVCQQEHGSKVAFFSALTDSSVLLLCDGQRISLTKECYRLVHMKDHFAQIHERLRLSLNTADSRHTYRRTLLKAGNFTEWSSGPLHSLARHVIDWAQKQGAGEVQVKIDELSLSFPWARLIGLMKSKAEEVGMQVIELSQTPQKNEQEESLRNKPEKKRRKVQEYQPVGERLQ